MRASIDKLIAKMDAASIFYDGDDCAGSNLWKDLKAALSTPTPCSSLCVDNLHELRQKIAQLCCRGYDNGVALVSQNTVLSLLDAALSATATEGE